MSSPNDINRVLNLLTGTDAGRIRFKIPMQQGFTKTTLALATVSRKSFQDVALAIKAGRIKLADGAAVSLAHGKAEYHSGRTIGGHAVPNTLYYDPPLRGRKEEGLILHECTHAAFDLAGVKNLSAFEEEAACYVVQALYLRMSGFSGSGTWWAPADKVADALRKAYAAHPKAVPEVTVAPGSWGDLLGAVATHTFYPNILRRGAYPHDG